jgi:muramoyltetrapeptide carboxypeptidase
VLCPPALRPGDPIRVVASSSPFDRTLVLRGMGWLVQHFRVEFDPDLFARDGFLAGSDARRLSELNRALAAPHVRAVVAARGGYGLSRISSQIDWRAFQECPKWIVGFSDLTMLHAEAWKLGIASLHAHNAAGLGRGDAHARASWLAALQRPEARRRLCATASWNGGSAAGPLVGGNLTMLFCCAAAGTLRMPPGCVLALEEVSESSYRVDRMLSTLLDAGTFDTVAAVVLGEFVDCQPGRYAVPVEAVLRERLGRLRVPVLAGLPFGHGRHNEPLPFGLPARVDASQQMLELGP